MTDKGVDRSAHHLSRDLLNNGGINAAQMLTLHVRWQLILRNLHVLGYVMGCRVPCSRLTDIQAALSTRWLGSTRGGMRRTDYAVCRWQSAVRAEKLVPTSVLSVRHLWKKTSGTVRVAVFLSAKSAPDRSAASKPAGTLYPDAAAAAAGVLFAAIAAAGPCDDEDLPRPLPRPRPPRPRPLPRPPVRPSVSSAASSDLVASVSLGSAGTPRPRPQPLPRGRPRPLLVDGASSASSEELLVSSSLSVPRCAARAGRDADSGLLSAAGAGAALLRGRCLGMVAFAAAASPAGSAAFLFLPAEPA